MKSFRRILALAVLVYLPVANAEVPSGFEKPGLMDKLMNGEIVMEETIDTATEFENVFRAYFNKTSPDAFGALMTDYAKYPSMFKEMKEAKQLSVNSDRTVFTYWLKMKVAIGPFSQTITPEGRHTLKINATGESRIVNEITNYQDYLNFATENYRMIPYGNGMLVEDLVHASLKKGNSGSSFVKKQLQKMFKGYLETFRKELKADY